MPTVEEAGLIAGSVIILIGGGACLFATFNHFMRKSKRNSHLLDSLDSEFFKEEEERDQTRVYNPMWIPSAVGEPKTGFTSRANPPLLKKRRLQFRQRSRDMPQKQSSSEYYSSPSEHHSSPLEEPHDDREAEQREDLQTQLAEEDVQKQQESQPPDDARSFQRLGQHGEESAESDRKISRQNLERLVNLYHKRSVKMDREIEKLFSNL